jgi:hypothetical protein
VGQEKLDLLPLDGDQNGIAQEGEERQADGGQTHDVSQGGLGGEKPEGEKATNMGREEGFPDVSAGDFGVAGDFPSHRHHGVVRRRRETC